MREKLIDLICSTAYGNGSLVGKNFQKGFIEKIADHIIGSDFIQEIQNEAYDLGIDSALHNHFGLSWEDAAGLRKEITRLLNATKWISVKDRLPQKNEPVLVYCKNKTIQGGATRHTGSCDNGFWFLKTQPGTESFPHLEWEVTHWMPLPAVPEVK